ncbi:MAG: signal peptide peptidase SppA [Lewinellaceae bacterium]|nr:signal peptide peptidase SppA [Lewinellaceae bacterium]
MFQFLRMMLASCLGFFLALLAISFIGIAIAGALASQGSKAEPIEANSVLRLTFDKPLPELTNNVSMQPFEFSEDKVIGLHDIVRTIEKAKDDDRIKGIFLDMEFPVISGYASAQQLRAALVDFQESGKFVVSHSKFYTQGTYYLASAANQVYANPSSFFEVRGFAAEIPFYRELADRLGVKIQVFYVGKYKGGTEPYRLKKLSPDNRYQYSELLHDIYDTFLTDVSKSRNLSREALQKIVNGYEADTPERAKSLGLIDSVAYRQQAMDYMRDRMGLSKKDKIKLVSLSNYFAANPPKSNYSAKDKVAVVYAEGTIMDGKGQNGVITDGQYIKDLEKIAQDDRIKAVVLRVNSPGGSAIASENIWYALQRVKEAGKPLVISMGNYAASGGYYISAPGDSIFAEPNTVTGSIGVYRIVPSLEGTMRDKIGITYDSVKTGPFALGLTPFFDLSEAESRRMQVQVDENYELFLKRVSEGRGLSRDAVNEIAQGRVWSGPDALQVKLVDRIGNLDDAMACAARMAKLSDYRVTTYPQVKDPLQQLVEELLNPNKEARAAKIMETQYPQWYPYLRELKAIHDSQGIQARLPALISVQ